MKKTVLLIIVFQILISIVISRTYLLSQNTLEHNNNWIVMKKQVQMELLGADNYYNTLVALRKNQLNLGAWHGFQGVLFKKQINPEEIAFDFFLTEGSYFYFIFNKNSEKFMGVRFSSNEAFDNIFVEGYDSGEFIENKELSVIKTESDKWNHVKMVFKEDGFDLFLNNKLIGTFNAVMLSKQYFGFRGSYNHVFIDNVSVKQKNTDEKIEESFSNNKNRLQSGLLIFAVVLMLNVGIGLFQIMRKHEFKKTAFVLISLNLMLLIMSTLSLLVFYYQNEMKVRYPAIHGIYRNLMKREKVYTFNDLRYVNNTILNTYMKEVDPDTYRILFIGTSQTRGAGARTTNETFVRVAERELNRKGNIRFECINAGVHGIGSGPLLQYYTDSWIKLRPKITIINLSNNDNDTEAFRLNLQKFVDLNKEEGIRTVFILEANSREVPSDLSSKHNIMRAVGKKNDLIVIDLHKYLLGKDDTGILWWDGVHMTSYGQKITAEFLADKILDIVKK